MALVVDRAQALSTGLTAREVDARVRSGRWIVLRRGVYLTQPALPSDPAHRHACLVAAAVLATSTPCVGSHTSAALVHGLPLLRRPSGPPVLTRAPGTPGNEVARRVADVPPEHCCLVLGAPVTTLARTAVDLARTGTAMDAVVVLDAVLGRIPRSELDPVLDLQRGWPGSARARGRVARADGRAESALESVSRLQFARLGLPAPELQVVLPLPGGGTARVDFLWRAHRTVGEADGRAKYGRPEDLWSEKRREDALRDSGLEVFRFGWSEAFHRPEVLRDRALRAFARAGRRAA
ncbi:MAG: hypothetical protein JWN17_224 [Frankiales bacterium]|nr:hypothetical protein [Frankiales bacterium]